MRDRGMGPGISKRLIQVGLMAVLAVVGGFGRASVPPSVAPADVQALRDEPDGACTAMCLDNGDHCVFATNMDHGTQQLGQVFVNKRHVRKTGWEPSTTGEYARWISRYGSVTLNAVGSQLPWAGMNEAGLMISTMSLIETEEPAPDERPPLPAAFWVQYQLDNHNTVAEVMASSRLVRVKDAYDHYLVCDGTGDCTVIEFLKGEMIAYTGSNLPVQALANSTYEDSLAALEDGNYWKIEALGVDPDGPAARAGIIEEDWITAFEGVELAGESSLQAFHSVLADREPGDEISVTLIHPGETEPVTVQLTMDALPEDLSKYVLPPGVPIQILSLGFLPKYPGNFLTRFATAAEWVAGFAPATSQEATAYAFDALEAVSEDDTVWSAVFDPANRRVYFRSNQNRHIRYIDFNALDFSCESPAKMLDVHASGAGDISSDLIEYSHEMALDHGVSVATNLWQVDVSALYAETILGGFESFACMEDAASAPAVLTHYGESYSPLVSPYATWVGLMLVRRFWPLWVGATLVSLALVIWRLARSHTASWGRRLAWILTVALLGPFGVLIYLLSHRGREAPAAA